MTRSRRSRGGFGSLSGGIDELDWGREASLQHGVPQNSRNHVAAAQGSCRDWRARPDSNWWPP